MKKILIFLIALTLSLQGCSSNEDTNSSATYFNITINGTAYEENNYPEFFGVVEQENCQSTGDLFLQDLAEIETSNFYFAPSIAHFENAAQFDNEGLNTYNSSRLVDRNSIVTILGEPDVCNRKFDLSLLYQDKQSDEYLKFKLGTPKVHNVTNVTFQSETQTEKYYIIEGNFSGTFENNGTDISVSGNYKTRIYVLK